MALHLLLFTSDAETALILGKLLAEFDIEVEFCSEILTSVEKVTREKFEAIVVDWDDGAEAGFLLKTVRELKSTKECVVLALASEPAAGACAVQAGAHGVLHKPIAPDEIRDTFSTIRELMASRQSAAASTLSTANTPPEMSPATGSQQEVWNPAGEGTSPKAVDDAKFSFLIKETRELPPLPPLEKLPEPSREQAYTGTLFSSSTQISEPRASRPSNERARKSGGKVVMVAVVVFVAAAAYVFSPGASYLERLNALRRMAFSQKEPPPTIVVEATPSAPDVKSNPVPIVHPAEKEPVPAVDDSADGEEAANIQVVPVVEPPDRGAPPAQVEAPVTSESASQTTVMTAQPSPAAPQPAIMPQSSPAAVRPSTLTTSEQTPVQVPQSLRLSNPINPVQTASTPGARQPFQNALTPLVLPEETANTLLIKKIQPTYPDQAWRAGIQGTVVLQACIGRDGSVRDVKLVRGAFVLARAAVDAVKQWAYKPYYVSGQPVEAQTLITVNFRLPSPGPNSGTPSVEIVSSRSLDSAKP